MLASSSKVRNEGYRVHGVYISWRGTTVKPYVDKNDPESFFATNVRDFGQPRVFTFQRGRLCLPFVSFEVAKSFEILNLHGKIARLVGTFYKTLLRFRFLPIPSTDDTFSCCIDRDLTGDLNDVSFASISSSRGRD